MAFFAENEYLGLQNGVKRLKTAKFCFIREILLFACLAGIEFAFFPVDALDGFCSRMFFYFFTFYAPFLPFKVFRPEAQMYYLMQIMFLCRSVFSRAFGRYFQQIGNTAPLKLRCSTWNIFKPR